MTSGATLLRGITWSRVAGAVFVLATLAIPLFYLRYIDPIFTQPNTFEDGLGYLVSAQRLLDTGSPYQEWQLAGPYGAVTPPDTYRYPPPFAQVAALFVATGTGWILLVVLVTTCFLAVLVLARSRQTAALALWLGFAFLPSYIAAWHGQVTGLLTIAVAFALLEFPAAIWAGAALKVTPILALPAALLRMPRSVIVSTAVLIPLFAVSVIASPLAWAQFPIVLLNQFLGSPDYESLALSGVARFGVLAVVGASLVGSFAFARTRWPFALYLAIAAGLLLPGFFPKYALPILLPFLYVGLLDRHARPWALLSFPLLAIPFISYPIFVIAGMTFLGVAMWQLGPRADRWESGRSGRPSGDIRSPDGQSPSRLPDARVAV